VLFARREQGGREIRGGTVARALRTESRLRGRIGLHDPPIKMPGRMAEHRHDHGEAEEAGQRSDQQQAGDDQSPQRHGDRARRDRAHGREQRTRGADVAIEQQRKRDHADGQDERGKQESDAGADDDEAPARRREQHVVDNWRMETGAA